MKLSEMRQLLAAQEIQLTKSLGQNFLHDANQLRRIVELAELTAHDRVLEIGPGLGPLTEFLLQRASKVLAIEKDRRLAAILESRFKGAANFELIVADALDYLTQQRHDWSGWKMVSNLPYSVASPLLVELAQIDERPMLMVATLQLEVVRRLVACPSEPDYGLLTVLVQVWYEAADWFKIPAGCFFPEPDVDSGCIKLVRRASTLLTRQAKATFTRVVKQGFSQRRKMMLKLLKQVWPEELLRQAFDAARLPEKVRAEAVSPERFVELSNFLYKEARE